MQNLKFKTDISTDFITQALDDFLRHKRLGLSDQQYDRLKKLLMIRLMDEELSYSNAYNQLSDIFEYRKDYDIDANALEEAEEEMIRIIGAADTQEVQISIEANRFKKLFMTTAGFLALIIISVFSFQGLQYFQNTIKTKNTVITKTQEDEIKTLVQKIVDLETAKGNTITTSAVYNQIKKLDSVQSGGIATSYKKFNNAQYDAAIEFLNNKIANIQPASGN